MKLRLPYPKQQGISLLEVLLVLTIATSVIVMAVRYFSITNRNLQVTHAITQIQTLTRASYEWLQSMQQQNFSSQPDGTAISLQQLLNAGLVDNNPRSTLDPWGGQITITPGADPSYVRITLTSIPQQACNNLATRLRSVSELSTSRCSLDISHSSSTTLSDYSGEF